MSPLSVVFVSYFCFVWPEARIAVLSLRNVGIPHCLWLLRFFEAGHTISDKPCPSITGPSWIWSLPHKYLIFQSSVSTFNYQALVGTRRSALTFQKLLKQTCYCLLHILGFKTWELTLGVYYSCLRSFGTSQHNRNVVIQTHKKPAKQSWWKMLSDKETEWLALFSSVALFRALTSVSKARAQLYVN